MPGRPVKLPVNALLSKSRYLVALKVHGEATEPPPASPVATIGLKSITSRKFSSSNFGIILYSDVAYESTV